MGCADTDTSDSSSRPLLFGRGVLCSGLVPQFPRRSGWCPAKFDSEDNHGLPAIHPTAVASGPQQHHSSPHPPSGGCGQDNQANSDSREPSIIWGHFQPPDHSPSIQASSVASLARREFLSHFQLARRLDEPRRLEQFPHRWPFGSRTWFWPGALRLGLTQSLSHWSWSVCSEPTWMGCPGQSFLSLRRGSNNGTHRRRVPADKVHWRPTGPPHCWRWSSWMAAYDQHTLKKDLFLYSVLVSKKIFECTQCIKHIVC